MRVWSGIALTLLLALLTACSAGAPSPAPTPTPTAAPTPTLAPAPTHRATGLIVNEPEAFKGYTLFTPQNSGLVYLIDNHGRVIHMWTLRNRPPLAKLLDNGNLLTSANRIFDADGNAVWDYRYPQHHDLLEMPNGNILSLSRVVIPREEAIALGANPDSIACPSLRATHIVEIRPTGPADGEIVWQWSALDHLIQDFDPEKPNYGVVADHPERIDINFALPCRNDLQLVWQYANALDYNEGLDQVMITVRRFSEIWIIDHSTSADEAAGHTGGNGGKGGDLLYRWGNPRAYQRGTLADQRLFGPHNAHWIPEGSPGAGNVLIFNNGSKHLGIKRGYSSVDEISLPADGYNYRLDEGAAYGPNDLVWTYTADPPDSFYSNGLSGAQRLPNGDTLITDGWAGRIFEVTREGETVWEFVNPAAGYQEVYRAYRYAPNHPGLRGLDLTPYHLTAYRAAAASEPVARSVFDLHLTDGQLVYVKEECDQKDTETRFFLHIAPERMDDLLQERREAGYSIFDFEFSHYGALFDGVCVARFPLPDHPITAVRTGQWNPQVESGLWSANFLWSANVRLNPEPYRAAYHAAATGEPVARSIFDLYVADGQLAYVKEECDQEDTGHRFFLHIVPDRADDLPLEQREHGFDNLDFDFFLNGALFDGKCVASAPLPEYPVVSVRTGQFGPQGEVWSTMFWLNPERYRAAYRAAAAGEPVARSVFDLYVTDGQLAYVKEECDQEDMEHRFFLHIVPGRADDLPQKRREHGFDNLDFDFFLNGALFGGKCVASVPLPEYPIVSVRTGQFGPQGEVWRAEFALGGGMPPP